MTRQYKTHPTRRPVKRFHVELPYHADPLPNDEYWQDKANGQLVALMDIVGEDKAREMTAEIEGTWHEINDAIKAIVEGLNTDPRGKRHTDILQTLATEPVDKQTALNLILELAEIQTDLQRKPADEPELGTPEWFDKIEPIEF